MRYSCEFLSAQNLIPVTNDASAGICYLLGKQAQTMVRKLPERPMEFSHLRGYLSSFLIRILPRKLEGSSLVRSNFCLEPLFVAVVGRDELVVKCIPGTYDTNVAVSANTLRLFCTVNKPESAEVFPVIDYVVNFRVISQS